MSMRPAAVLLCSTLLAPAVDRPNILFLFADDQRADTIHALGNPHIKTPNLDRLVQRGQSFDRAYMQGGLQGATCTPSRAMLLSGRGLFRCDEKLERDPTWPAAFGAAGYATFMTGKWHNGHRSIGLSFQEARSVFAGGMTDPLKAKLSDWQDGRLAPPQVKPQHACATFADEAIRFIGAQKPDHPFLCYVPFDAPHDPHVVPGDFAIRYDPAALPVPTNLLPQHPFDNGEMVIRDEHLLPWPRTAEAVQGMNAGYYQYISYLDVQVGRILDALDASPHARNTIVVYAADSGVARGSHGLIGKQNCYEHSMRVPLVIAGPGIPADRRTPAMCYLFDVFPTLGRRCGVAAPATSEGLDLGPVLADPARPARDAILLGYRQVQRAVSDGRWKLIRYPQVDRTQLFDLAADPQEVDDLAARPEHLATIGRLLALMQVQQRLHGDAAPIQVERPRPATWTPPAGKSMRKPDPH